jgi:DNA-binding NarL/FixJ family response regulator
MISEHNFFTFQVDQITPHFGRLDLRGKSPSVFLVEDSLVIRHRLKRLLAEVERIQIIGETGDAQEAISAIQTQKPDIVLLDIHLLNGCGIDVLQVLKKSNPAPAVIVLTNYPYQQYRQKCIAAGADFFLVKSTEFDQIIPALTQLIQRTRS